MDELVTVLLSSLRNQSPLNLNITFLSTIAVQYEADFFILNKSFRLLQSVHIFGVKKDFNTIINLHSFHSTRRIYGHIASTLNLSILSISLRANE
jgi:hypothetical protein